MRTVFVLPLVILAGCATTSRDLGPVALEQTQRVGNLYITPLNVVADHRCPEGRQCDLPGRITVRALVDRDLNWGGWGWGGGGGPVHGDTERNFTLGVPTEIGRRTIVLESVTPEPSPATLVSSAPYRFRFVEIDR